MMSAMIPELGHFAMVIALCVSLLMMFIPLLGAWLGVPEWTRSAVPAARALFLFVGVAYGVLTYAFVTGDFSVAYVAQNSSSELPLFYRVSAVWGAHEGSMLLWSLVLAVWTLAVSQFSKSLPDTFRARVLAILGGISSGFLAFMLATSNPFARLLPAAAEGRDLNPLLQDPGMVIHPPLLYVGYVGLAVPFAFACAALMDGRLNAAWTRWTRPWTIVAWVFLTLGIAIGSWWAYNELGWGGWWFWDPVENASFMPWLLATALLHSLAVTEQRGAFKAWTVLLAIFGFSLSLLGTFLVRSGVLVSVHAFATDPERGVFILTFLAIVIGGALTLYAWRAASVSGGGRFTLLSRETLLLTNNVLLAAAAGTVLLGTLFPLFMDALSLGKISVGPPYFNLVFIPLMVPLLLLMGVGPLSRWKKDTAARLVRQLGFAAAAATVLGIALAALATEPRIGVGAALVLALWIAFSTLQSVIARVRNRSSLGRAARSLNAGFLGMTVAHLGIAITAVGVVITSAYSVERDVRLAPGGSTSLSGYRFEFGQVSAWQGPNFNATSAEVKVYDGDRQVATLTPEKRRYFKQEQPMTEAAIDATLGRDLYVALGEPLGDGAWAVRVYYKPFIRWIWLGALIMAFGGLLAACDRRYRRPLPQGRRTAEVDSPPAGGQLAPEPALRPQAAGKIP